VHEREPQLLNAGLYTVPEAARLTRISVGKVRRWLKGYDFRSGTSLHHSDAVWQGEIKPIENKLALSFRDLLELRFVDAFIRAGVSWRTMRRAHTKAQQKITHYPSVLLEPYLYGWPKDSSTPGRRGFRSGVDRLGQRSG
jgi:hypothetical protein